MPGFHDRLRTGTDAAHTALEAQGFWQAVRAGTAPLSRVATFLRGVSILQATVEHAMQATPEPRISTLAGALPPALPRLLEDIRELTGGAYTDDPRALQPAMRLASSILHQSLVRPAGLVGAAYLLAGSQLGNALLRDWILAREDAAGLTLSHLGRGQADGGARWQHFLERLDTLALSEAEERAAIEQANAGFQALSEIARALHEPTPGEAAIHATAINPEAGYHTVPQDPDEVRLALMASAESWQAFAYLGARYGERGMRFSASDSAWLATLHAMPPRVRRKQTRWLAGVLSARGIPTLILEHQLQRLASAFAAHDGAPHRSEAYAALAADLREARTGILAEEAFDMLAAACQAELDACPESIAGLGGVLVSARVDQRNGYPKAWQAVAGWCTDPERFPVAWREAMVRVESLLRTRA